MEITQELVRQKFFYHPEAGLIFRKNKKGQLKSLCNYAKKDGYVQFHLGDKMVLAHRIAWIYCYGDIDGLEIDHIDGNPSNNRLSNLRLASHQQNMCNRVLQKNNTSGISGVSWKKDAKKWFVYVYKDKKRIQFGCFDNLLDAAACSISKRKILHGEFARLNN